MQLGTQILADYRGCCAKILNNTDLLEAGLVSLIQLHGGTVVRSVFHTFNPFGVTGVVIIAESHVAIHTWPEYGLASVDIYSCSIRLKQDELALAIQKLLRAESYVFSTHARPPLNEVG